MSMGTGAEIADFLMKNNTVTKFELKGRYNLMEKEAEAIWTLFPSAYGPGGRGYKWFSDRIDRILSRHGYGGMTASSSRHCAFYMAHNGKWYMELADNEYEEREDATTYGPFDDLKGWNEDDSGKKPIPVRSPNGLPVINPKKGRWGREQRIVNHMTASKYGDEIRPGEWSYVEGKGPRTPWGPAQQGYQIANGVMWYSTASHGGLGVSSTAARHYLSPMARLLALRWGGAYWYEEDVDWAIAFYEHPEWSQRFSQLAGGSSMSKERIEETVRRWSPEYFEQDANEKAKSNEPPRWNTLKAGDIITLDTRPSEFVIEESHGKLLGRDTTSGKIYRMPTNTFDQRVLKIVRDGRTLWEKMK